MKKIVILDYGSSNLRSVAKAIETIGYTPITSNDAATIKSADLLILPGQGAFKQAMSALESLGLIDIIKAHILSKKPYIGICLGFQILFEISEEHGMQKGLGLFSGTVSHFSKYISKDLSIPQMGWNTLNIKNDALSIFTDITPEPYTYFVHSYAVFDTSPECICTSTHYGVNFVSSIQTDTVFATQFHPEKSGDVGLSILKNALLKLL